MTQPKEPLTLLGIWNILALGNWVWWNDDALAQLERLTGRKLRLFFFIKNDLHYQSFLKKDTDLLKADFAKMSPTDQHAFVQKITDDFYRLVPALEKQIKLAEDKNFPQMSDAELAQEIEALASVWSKVTMQIWYALLLDLWYPGTNEKLDSKAVIAKARDHAGHLHAESDQIEHQMYVEAAKRLGLTERQIYFAIQPEVVSALRGETKFDENTLNSRIELCVETNIDGSLKIYGGAEAQKIIDGFAVPSIGAKKEGDLKGTPASLGDGKITGRAHVILLDREFPEFQEGEILVSLQTMVHYLPIMKKAKAILTEFGGLTSHAAIVSRELKKPAVVGISGLINSVKTGDMLEIDPVKGVVRKVT